VDYSLRRLQQKHHWLLIELQTPRSCALRIYQERRNCPRQEVTKVLCAALALTNQEIAGGIRLARPIARPGTAEQFIT